MDLRRRRAGILPARRLGQPSLFRNLCPYRLVSGRQDRLLYRALPDYSLGQTPSHLAGTGVRRDNREGNPREAPLR